MKEEEIPRFLLGWVRQRAMSMVTKPEGSVTTHIAQGLMQPSKNRG